MVRDNLRRLVATTLQRKLAPVAHGAPRVGGIYDPIWGEPLPAARHDGGRRRRGRRPIRRKRSAMAAAAVVGLLAIGLGISMSGSRSGGDPHDHVYDLLRRTVRGAVPGVATEFHWGYRTPARWETACPLIPRATSGWSPVSVSVDFVDRDAPATITAQLNAALSRHGWARHDEVVTVGQGRTAHWTLAVSGGRPASAFAYAVPAGSDHWTLSAGWRPPGPVGEPCP